MNYDRDKMITQINLFFDSILTDPQKYDIQELIVLIESIIPVHAELLISSFDEVDVLLSVYPFLYQKVIKLYAYFIHKVREAVQGKNKSQADAMRSYRDPIEQILKAIKLQYDALSRRITNSLDRRS